MVPASSVAAALLTAISASGFQAVSLVKGRHGQDERDDLRTTILHVETSEESSESII